MKKLILLLSIIWPLFCQSAEPFKTPIIEKDYSHLQITSHKDFYSLLDLAWEYTTNAVPHYQRPIRRPEIDLWENKLVIHSFGVACDIEQGCPVVGKFLPLENTIIFDFTALLIDQELLFGLMIHEYIHAFQHANYPYVFTTCDSRLRAEIESYSVQQRWLETQGIYVDLVSHSGAAAGSCDSHDMP